MADTLARTVALVGRPNVGKSRLFNRLAGKRLAIVHDQPGVTRDVNSTHVAAGDFTLLDTGGLGLVADPNLRQIVAAAEEQVWFAIEAAGLICFVVDGQQGLTPLDETLAERLRASGKPVLLVVNKIDLPRHVGRADDFARLGLGDPIAVSAEHGYHEDRLREEILEVLGPPPPEPPPEAARIRIAFVGRPNVGKSSLCNALFKAERLVVSEVPGTTRDSVALDLDYQAGEDQVWRFRLVDTAGVRKRTKVDSSVEYFSGLRTRESFENAEVVFLVIDALEGVTSQDKALAGEMIEAGRCVAVIVNKWDLARERLQEPDMKDDEATFRRKYAEAALRELFFLPDSPVLFTSARTGYALDRVLTTARRLWEISGRTLPTPKVNRALEKLMDHRQPKLVAGKRFKVYYAVQTGNRPFSFRLFCNRATKLDDNYRRYLEGGLVEEFGLGGCPIRFELRGKTVRYAGAKS